MELSFFCLQGSVGLFAFKWNIIHLDFWSWLVGNLLVWTVQTITLVKLEKEDRGEF